MFCDPQARSNLFLTSSPGKGVDKSRTKKEGFLDKFSKIWEIINPTYTVEGDEASPSVAMMAAKSNFSATLSPADLQLATGLL